MNIADKLANSKSLIEDIKKMQENDVFKSYIYQIRFPFYKNFLENSEINFTFPLTVFVGKNGSGKSSLLHALYGCPYRYSIREYWFSTATDPIEDGNGKNERQSLIYKYSGISSKDNKYKENQEVLLHRAHRPGTKTKKKDPDYWESAKPVKRLGMNVEERCSPIKEEVQLLDFRQQLSAYDKFFYFGNIDDLKTDTRQNFIRGISPKLEESLTNNRIYCAKGKIQNKKVEILGKEDLEIISYILNAKYISGKLLEHKFYREWGYSALITKDAVKYTEANAGSGEYAIIKLVHRLNKIQKPTLILLDEPETSLYPGAQERLLNYLLWIIRKTKSQVVISTHSERFVSKLPDDSIKAIHYDPTSSKSSILENCQPSTVFNDLEIPIVNKSKIIVEDKAAELLLKMIAENEKIINLSIQNIGCGASYLKKNSILQSALSDDQKTYYILDGDQKIDKEPLDINKLNVDELKNPKLIDELVEKISKRISFPSSKPRKSENKNLAFDKIKHNSQIKYLRFFYSNVFFLPKNDPETIFYDENIRKQLEEMVGAESQKATNANPKQKMHDLFKIINGRENGTSDQYYMYLKLFIKSWISKENNDYSQIASLLKKISKKIEEV